MLLTPQPPSRRARPATKKGIQARRRGLDLVLMFSLRCPFHSSTLAAPTAHWGRMKATAWRRAGPKSQVLQQASWTLPRWSAPTCIIEALPLGRPLENFTFVGKPQFRRMRHICGKQSGDSHAAYEHDKLIGLHRGMAWRTGNDQACSQVRNAGVRVSCRLELRRRRAGQIAHCRGTGGDVGEFLFGAGAKRRLLQEARARAGDFLYPAPA